MRKKKCEFDSLEKESQHQVVIAEGIIAAADAVRDSLLNGNLKAIAKWGINSNTQISLDCFVSACRKYYKPPPAGSER
jgi:hypothetical protein